MATSVVQEEVVEPEPEFPRLKSSQQVSLSTASGETGSFRVLSYKESRVRWPRMPLADKDMPAWPESPDAGQAWRSGQFFCIPMTIGHVIDNELGQVNSSVS